MKFDQQLFDDTLNEFRLHESDWDSRVVILANNDNCKKAVITWSEQWVIHKDECLEYPGQDAPREVLWDWLWECITIDIDSFMYYANVSSLLKYRIFRILVHHHLIYPDGKVPGYAIAYIAAHKME